MTFECVTRVLKLDGLLGRLPHTLSEGQRQRVELGRALLLGQVLLSLSELRASEGETLKDRLLDYVEQVLSEWEVPTLYVTHNPAEVGRLAAQVVRLEAGRVVAAVVLFFFQAEDGIRDGRVTGVQTCALPIDRPCPRWDGSRRGRARAARAPR